LKAKILIVAFLVVHVSPIQAGQRLKRESLLDRARQGDGSALSEMENSDDVRDFRILLHDPGYGGKSAVRLALARLGDSATLQYYACLSLTNDVFHIEELMRQDLDYIGGDFTIQVYRHLLDSDPRYRPQIKQVIRKMSQQGGDSWPQLPSTLRFSDFPNWYLILRFRRYRRS
jgi:hypothetical protein